MDEGKNKISKQLIEVFENVMKVEQESINHDAGKRLSMSEIHTMSAIGIDVLCSMGEIAKKLHITVGTLTVAINNLVKKGYVERYKNENDRRIVKIGLTKQGKEIYHIHETFHQSLVNTLIQNLTEDETLVVAKAMSNLEQFVEQGYKKMDSI